MSNKGSTKNFINLIFSAVPKTASLFLCIFALTALLSFSAVAQIKYEDRTISDVQITFAGSDRDISTAEQFRVIAKNRVGDKYSTVKIREAIQSLYETNKIVSVQVEANSVGTNQVSLRFIIKKKTQTDRVTIELTKAVGDEVTEDELLLRANLTTPGTMVTEQAIRNDATEIQTYLRSRGFYNAEVTYRQQTLGSDSRIAVTFVVNPKTQAKVGTFNINIEGFDAAKLAKLKDDLRLKPNENFTDRRLETDVTKVRQALIKEEFLAPQLQDAKPTFDPEKNLIDINLTGKVGPKVVINVDAGDKKVGKTKQNQLLPVTREGTLETSAIVEGERRLRNYFQEQGYFFATVASTCSVDPPLPTDITNPLTNDTNEICGSLSSSDLEGKTVQLNYKADLNRRLKLVDIRVEGTDEFTYPEIATVLDTQKASLLGLIPRLGYGRGYTSLEILSADQDRLRTVMRELGYRNAKVTARQGVSPTGDDLIITFVIEEGIPTRIREVDIAGNNVFSDDVLSAELPDLVGKNYSRARARNGVQKLSALYAREGYYDAKVSFSLVDLPKDAATEEEKVKIVYNVENEGKKVFISRILINGNERTKRDAVIKALNLKEGTVLRATDVFTSEQNLYSTDVFRRVEIKPEAAGENANGDAQRDVVVNLDEQPPRIITYGGGFSTDFGPTGFFDIRHVNLFGKLQQGGARVRMSRLQQLVQLDYLIPRFIRDGKNGYAPLTVRAEYQRDSTITRFFRSTFDRGTFGVVQRVDADGNPIDVFGNNVSQPTLNRFTLTAETQRTISRAKRSLLFVRYKYEDVRIFNVDSLLIGDLLRPDEKIRTSGFEATLTRDTRENCLRKFSVLELIAKGELGDPCRYSASDPTRGNYFNLEYSVSAPVLGANIGFQKFRGTFQTYYSLPKFTEKLDNTVLAGRVILGLSNVFNRSQNFTGQFAPLNGSLPISERFFAGGSTTLRGFDFESAGPRVVVVPQGTFRNSNGDPVTLDPFTIPFGGNALAITNLEARIPLTTTLQAVPFYDGGNVFNRVGDIFKPLAQPTGDVFTDNLRATWKHTFGFGLRVKTPFGGAAAVDYGYMLNPPQFLIPQIDGSNAIYRLRQGQLHFRFSQSF